MLSLYNVVYYSTWEVINVSSLKPPVCASVPWWWTTWVRAPQLWVPFLPLRHIGFSKHRQRICTCTHVHKCMCRKRLSQDIHTGRNLCKTHSANLRKPSRSQSGQATKAASEQRCWLGKTVSFKVGTKKNHLLVIVTPKHCVRAVWWQSTHSSFTAY